MTLRIICMLNEAPDEGVLSWGAFKERERLVVTGFPNSGEGTFDDFTRYIGGFLNAVGEPDEVMGILPGEACAMRQMPTPPKSDKKFRAAANLLLEDELAEPIEDIHVATSSDAKSDGTTVGDIFAIKRSLLDDWLTRFSSIGIPLSHVTVDFLCLAAISEDKMARRLAVFPDRMLWLDGTRGFAAEVGLAGSLIEKLVQEGQESIIFLGSEKLFHSHFRPYANYHGPIEKDSFLNYAADAFASGDGSGPVNFLQGSYRVQKKISFDFGIWRRAAVLAACFVGAIFALSTAEGRRNSALAARYESEAVRIYEEYFPGAPKGNIRAQARAMLASGGASSFADLSARLNVALKTNEQVAINRILYDPSRGVYSFTLASLSNSAIDDFRQSLASAGMIATDASGYRRSGEFWVGEMTAQLR